MSWQFRFHPLAKEEYKTAYVWYQDQQSGLGERFGKAIRHKLQQIADHPEAFGSRSNIKFREAGVEFFPFQIIFKIRKRSHEIFISAIHHTSRSARKKYRK
jgi:plasmid stabilization system protein ParE